MLIWGNWEWHQPCSWVCQVSWFSGNSALSPLVLPAQTTIALAFLVATARERVSEMGSLGCTASPLGVSDKFSISVGMMLNQQKALGVQPQHLSPCWSEWMCHRQLPQEKLQCLIRRARGQTEAGCFGDFEVFWFLTGWYFHLESLECLELRGFGGGLC